MNSLSRLLRRFRVSSSSDASRETDPIARESAVVSRTNSTAKIEFAFASAPEVCPVRRQPARPHIARHSRQAGRALPGTGVTIFTVLAVCLAFSVATEAQITLPSAGNISTIAGNGTYGYTGDGGAATSAELANPTEAAIDGAGNIYFSDYTYTTIRKVNASTGVITTV